MDNWGNSEMSFSGFTGNWLLNNVAVTRAVGDVIQYKYFVDWDSTRFDEGHENYIPGIEPEALITEDKVEGGTNVDVTFKVNMQPATEISDDPFDPASDSLYILFETPFFALTQGMTVGAAAVNDAVHPDSVERQRFTDHFIIFYRQTLVCYFNNLLFCYLYFKGWLTYC